MSDCFYLLIIVFNLYIFIRVSMKEEAFCSFCAVLNIYAKKILHPAISYFTCLITKLTFLLMRQI